jgi:ABC-type multidrug transport system ATPase subunit
MADHWMEPASGAGAVTSPELPSQRTLVGRARSCDLMLASPRVSARHAEILTRGHAGWVRDLNSRYGTQINNRPVSDWAPFGPSDRVSVGGCELRLGGAGKLEVTALQAGATVCAAGLGVAVNNGRTQILRNLSFVVRPRELVALMGPSGAGKSTLLKALVGLIEPSWGSVLIDGVDLTREPVRARQAIGYVPQDDIVHCDLTVREALRYGAILRLPPDTSQDEIESRIAVLLNDLEISRAADVIIGSADRPGISGGQRKRVNLALELLARPPLLILDEPTSGLSSEDASNVFALLRQLANEGHTVLVTTHQPSLSDFQRLDHTLILSDGELVYYGPAWPDSARYFESATRSDARATPAGDAGAALASLTELKRAGVAGRQLADRYEVSPYFDEYVVRRLGALDVAGASQRARQPVLEPMGAVRQLCNQAARYCRLKLRNRGSLPIQLAQAPVIAALLNVVFDAKQPDAPDTLASVLNYMVIVSIWFGCSNSAREIVGERPIMMRERMVGLGVGSYMLSKLGVLGALSGIQCTTLLAISYAWRGLGGSFAEQLSVLWLSAMIGVLLGLTISALARSSEAALSATPLVLIPQTLLSGSLVALTHGGLLDQLSKLTASRWAFEALLISEGSWSRHRGLQAIASAQLGSHAAGSLAGAAGWLVGLAVLYAVLLTAALSGTPRRFA